jgi:hypothetical protein
VLRFGQLGHTWIQKSWQGLSLETGSNALSDAVWMSLSHSNEGWSEVAHREITTNGLLVYSWVPFGSESIYLCFIATFRLCF